VRHTNYDEIASAYDRRYAEDDYSDIGRALFDFIGNRPVRVLEVGCGTGHWLHVLQHRNTKAFGIDPAGSMLSRAQSKLPGGRLARARAEALPFPSGSFDRLFCINAHHHFGDKPRFLEEAHRVLRAGGSMMTVALDPHSGTDRWWVYDYFDGTLEIDKQRYPSCEQIRRWMRNTGFVDTNTCEIQHLPGDVAADEALEGGMIAPSHTSQLAVLRSDEFSAGLERIRAALDNDKGLRLSADLRLYATYAAVQ